MSDCNADTPCSADAGTVTPELLELTCRALAGGNAARPGVENELRAAFPGFHFAVCLDNDIPSRISPLAKGEGFALYGVSTGGHCAALTSRLEAATGLAIALLDDEDD